MSPPADRGARSHELDDVTLARAQRGEAGACRALVEHHQRPVFALLSRVLGPRGRGALVEDLAQETFLRAFRALASFDRGGPARLSTWVLTIAARLAIDELRRRAPETEPIEALETIDAALPSPSRADERLMRRAIGEAVQKAVEALPAEYRAAFVLREYHELDYDEIAAALGVDLGTVKSRLSRARASLRASLAALRAEVDDA